MSARDDGLQVGDLVSVFFEYTEAEHDVEVKHIPCATGDSWILHRQDGTPVHVQMFTKMVKRLPFNERPKFY